MHSFFKGNTLIQHLLDLFKDTLPRKVQQLVWIEPDTSMLWGVRSTTVLQPIYRSPVKDDFQAPRNFDNCSSAISDSKPQSWKLESEGNSSDRRSRWSLKKPKLAAALFPGNKIFLGASASVRASSWCQRTFNRGSGCGSVGRAVASDIRDPRFGLCHWLNFIYQLYNTKDKNEEKESGNGPL